MCLALPSHSGVTLCNGRLVKVEELLQGARLVVASLPLPRPRRCPSTTVMDPAFSAKIEGAQKATDGMMDDMDRKCIRPLQKASLLKMAACTDLPSRSQIDSCLQKSQGPMNLAQQIINNEMQQFQHRLERCMLDCQDAVRDANHRSEDASQKAYYSCASSCMDKNMALLRPTQARIEKEILEKAKV